MFIQNISDHADDLTHCKCGKDCSDSKTFDMTEEEEGQSSCHGEAGYVKGDLDFGIRLFNDLGEISWEQVGWDDREFAAVGKGDTEAEDQIACHKVEHPKGNGKRQCVDPDLMNIYHFSKGKTGYETK